MRARRNQIHSNNLLKTILVILVLISGIFLYQWGQYNYFISTPVNINSTSDIILTIKKGDNIKNIAENLHQKSLILNEDSFKWYTKLNSIDKQIKSGRFTLNQSLTVPEITQILVSDKNRQDVITIPEGSTVEDIDNILSDNSLIKPGEFLKAVTNFQNYKKYPFLNKDVQSKLIYPLEGYLFPDTYFLNASNFNNDLFISQLLNTFSTKVLPETTDSSYPLDQIINVAAMVEKEANKKQDRPIIAGIIWKRLKEKWSLGIDATLLYLKKDRSIDYQELQEENGYNTRKYPGLPPGPINNPGLASIKAAAKPTSTPYYYYLTSQAGEMIYAVTNTEHNQNKAKYL